MRRSLYSLTLATAGLVLASYGLIAANGQSDTHQELAGARRATARYHNLSQALADGYVDINVVVAGQGRHYLNSNLLDANFDPESPELLVYAADKNGRLRLVAVEYAVPLALSANPPEGFTGDQDLWDTNVGFGLWTLHAWLWLNNPNGIFADVNPRVD
jgi:hypothetical protein